jgi:hypothetical protein
MDCRHFLENHCAYIDDTLAGIELVAMQRHIAECRSCSERDAKVKRALLLFRNVPQIQPSRDFEKNLQERIKMCSPTDSRITNRPSILTAGIAAAVISIAMLGYIAFSLPRIEASRDIMMPPVVASIPELDIPSVSAGGPAIVASVSAGLPIWTAALYAEQAPQHFARPEVTLVSYTR